MLSRSTNVSDGTTANRLNYTVFKDSKAITSGDVSDAFQNKTTKAQTVSLPLITGETYTIVFWADNSSSPYSYSEGVVTVDYTNAYANDENADAFFGIEKDYTVTGAASKTVTLTRPLAQINFGTTKADYEAAKTSGLDVTESAVAIKTQTYSTFNLIDESVADAVDEVTYLNLTTPTDEDDPFSLNPDQRAALTVDGTDYVYVGYAYVLTQPVGSAENLSTVTLTPASAGETVRTYTNVPIKRNYRTNIIGNLFTSSVDWTVKIDQNYVEDINIEVWDGSIEQPSISGTTVQISNAAQLAWLSDYVNYATENLSRADGIPFDFSGYTVELTEDIYLGDTPWTPIGLNADSSRKFKGTFDGQGYTIYNLYVEQEAAYRAAGLFGALNGTAKDFTIDGAYINSLSSGSATDNGIAVVAGSIYDGGTIDGVTVKNAEVYGNRYCGGVSGYTYGNVTNCTVDGITIVCTPDNLTGSYDNGDKAGGLAGYFVDKSTYVVDNCTVNNAKVTGFRDLGGLIGCANKVTSVTNCTVSNTKIIPSSTNAYNGHSAGENTDLIVGRQYSGPLPASNTAVNTTINITEFNGETYAYDDTPWDGETTQEPTVDSDGNVIVASAAQLAGLAAMVNAGEELYQKDVYLLCDVDLAGYNWTSIGCEANKFGGNFDGQGHTISNLYIKDSIEPGVYEQSQNCGLFGWVRRERRYEIKNFNIHNAEIVGAYGLGVICGEPHMYTFSDITVTGKVTVKGTASVGGMFGYYCYSNLANLTMDVDPGSYVEAEVYVGGIVGHRTEGNLTATNLKSNIDVYASNGQVGGIAGVALYNNQYINCSSSGDVYVVTDSETKNSKYIGGIIGSWSSAQATVTLTNCSYTGTLHYVLAGEEQTLDDPQQLAGPTYNSGTGELIIN